MKLDSGKTGTLLGLAALLAFVPSIARADQWDKKTIVTVHEPIQVTDTYLAPGTYVFKLADATDRHIVQIYNRDQNHLINTIIANPNYRVDSEKMRHNRTEFTFWETPPGAVRAMRGWFYPGDNFGWEFRYPANLRLVSQVTAPAPSLAVPAQTETKVAPEPEAAVPEVQPSEPALKTAPQISEEQEEQQSEQSEQLAQNNPPPAPAPEAAPAPVETPVEPPAELPHTASPYPLIGLCGLLSVGLGTLLRVRRVS